AGAATRFTLQDAEALAEAPETKRTSANVQGRAQVVYEDKNWNTQVQGVGVDYETMRAATPKTGRFFTEDELRTRQKVALLGTTVVNQLFGDANPVGSVIKISRISFTVIGILPEKGSSGWNDQDDT